MANETNEANDKKDKSIITGLLAGALAGVALGLMFAPKAGRETRDLVRRKRRDYTSAVREKIREKGNSREKDE